MKRISSFSVRRWHRMVLVFGAGVLLALMVLAFIPSGAEAAVPKLINFQGILKDGSGNPVANASYSVTFTIYDAATGGNNLWTETQSVTTTSGLFAVLLGTSNPVPDTAFKGSERWLGIAVSPDPEMTPRQQLVSVAYGFRISSVDGASGGTITSKVSIGPGHTNTGLHAFVAGEGNIASGNWSTVGGGDFSTASGDRATVGGGTGNGVSGSTATVGGGSFNTASGNVATVGGGTVNTASGLAATIGGGQNNNARGQYSVVAGGGGVTAVDSNSALGSHATIGGGRRNTASANYATVSGGARNTASGDGATVGGGGNGGGPSFFGNTASGPAATVVGGVGNTASNFNATVCGGFNTASGNSAMVAGGQSNIAAGSISFAAGLNAQANHDGAFVWGSDEPTVFASTGNRQFLIRASGGVGIGTNNPATTLHVANSTSPAGITLGVSAAAGGYTALLTSLSAVSGGYASLQAIQSSGGSFGNLILNASGGNVGIGTAAPAALLHVNGTAGNGTGVWSNLSDRRLKQDIEPIRNALKTVEQLQPVSFRWKDAKKDAEYGRVRGLIAQDVEKVIPEWVKTDPDGYKRLEPIGVDALLIEAIKELKTENESLKDRNKDLSAEMKELKALVQKLLAKKEGAGQTYTLNNGSK